MIKSIGNYATTKPQAATKPDNMLHLSHVDLFNKEYGISAIFTSKESNNYYRANDIFGDTATKKEEYPNQKYIPSALNDITKATPTVDYVFANIIGFFTSETAKDAKASDIFAKQIGTWTADGKTVGGGIALEKTDAYKFALEINEDDFTTRESEYKGQKESHSYLDMDKSDCRVTLFSTEVINGKEYIAMRDKNNKIHYFDKQNNLSDVTDKINK